MALVDHVVASSKDAGQAATGFGICRPPGHHAIAGAPYGFCLFGTIAVAAKYAQQQHGLNKVNWQAAVGKAASYASQSLLDAMHCRACSVMRLKHFITNN